LTETLTSLNS